MDFDLSKAQKLLGKSAREFFSRECGHPRVRALMASDTAFDEGLWRAMADQGWTGMIIPEEFGGLGLGLVDLVAVSEEMGRACLPGPFLSTLWASSLIDRAGNEGQRKQYLEAVSTGDLKATVALLEEDADWSPDRVAMRADREGKAFRLRGVKHFVPDAAVADLIITVARSGKDLLLLTIPRGSAGLTVTSTPGLDATRKLYSLNFDNVLAPEAEALAHAPNPQEALEEATRAATVALTAEMVGGMQWTLENTVEYAKSRRQFDKPIGVYQAVQHQCADMYNFTEGARSAVYYAAWAMAARDRSAKLAVSIAKAHCSDAARETGNRGMQVNGGVGFTWEHPLHLYYKRAKSAEILFGDAGYHREQIARQLIDQTEEL